MLELMTDPTAMTIALAALAVVLPLAARIAGRRWGFTARQGVVATLLGPAVFMLWLIHVGVLEVVGFDRVASAAITLGVATLTGLGAGVWLGAEVPGGAPAAGQRDELD